MSGIKCLPGCKCGRHTTPGRPKKSRDVTHLCGVCGREFTMPEWARERRSCPDCSSKKCLPGCQCGRHDRRTWERKCEHCGGTFMGMKRARFCSAYCRERVRYLANPERAHEAVRRFMEKNPGKYSDTSTAWSMSLRDRLRRELWLAQDGKCYLCGDPIDLDGDQYHKGHIEHDHRCHEKHPGCEKCRRGLACGECNRIIGRAHDDPERLRRIADNLERAKALVEERMAESVGRLF